MKESNELKIVAIKENIIIVVDDINGRTAIAKYTDEGGVYFFDENNQKKYCTEAQTVKKYTFKTTLYCERKGTQMGEPAIKSFYAVSREEAMEKQFRHYGGPMDREIISVN